jgi:hypothetical protein
VEGTYAAVSLSLPRVRDDVFSDCLETARSRIIQAALAHVPADEPSQPGDAEASLLGGQAASVSSLTKRNRATAGARSVAAGARSVAAGARSVAAGARSVAAGARSVAGRRLDSAGSAAGHGGAQLPVERKIEVEAERLRLIRMLLDREHERRRAVEEPGLAGTGGRQASPGGEAGDAAEPHRSGGGHEPSSSSPPQRPPLTRQATTIVGSTVTAGRVGSPGPAALAAAAAERATGASELAAKDGGGEADGKSARNARVAIPVPPHPALAVAHYVLDFGYVVKGVARTKKFKLTNTSSQQVGAPSLASSSMSLWAAGWRGLRVAGRRRMASTGRAWGGGEPRAGVLTLGPPPAAAAVRR